MSNYSPKSLILNPVATMWSAINFDTRKDIRAQSFLFGRRT